MSNAVPGTTQTFTQPAQSSTCTPSNASLFRSARLAPRIPNEPPAQAVPHRGSQPFPSPPLTNRHFAQTRRVESLPPYLPAYLKYLPTYPPVCQSSVFHRPRPRTLAASPLAPPRTHGVPPLIKLSSCLVLARGRRCAYETTQQGPAW